MRNEYGANEVNLFLKMFGLVSRELEGKFRKLSRREREIINFRYGLGGRYIYTLAECADMFSVSKKRIRQIELRALRKLGNNRNKRKLEFITGWHPGP